ncbi:MAG TPA: hypothetical protein VG323_06400 [Thermoanaerobaculia bacterium]|nr:hypothetical protein [Thermoanaerobaculia bacterium]
MLLLATVGALTGCRLAEHGRRAAIDAFASFVLDSVLRVQKAAPLTQAAPSGGQALLPVPRVAAAQPVPPPAHDRHECLSSTELPKPVSRLVSVDLTPKAEFCRVIRVRAFDVARARIEVRMAMAEMRGTVPDAPASL